MSDDCVELICVKEEPIEMVFSEDLISDEETNYCQDTLSNKIHSTLYQQHTNEIVERHEEKVKIKQESLSEEEESHQEEELLEEDATESLAKPQPSRLPVITNVHSLRNQETNSSHGRNTRRMSPAQPAVKVKIEPVDESESRKRRSNRSLFRMRVSKRKGGRWCSVPNCKNNSNTNEDMSFFSFPKDEERANKWAVNSRREDLLKRSATYMNKNCTICSVHFESKFFLNFLRNRLKPDAVPTLFCIPNVPKQMSAKAKALATEASQVARKSTYKVQSHEKPTTSGGNQGSVKKIKQENNVNERISDGKSLELAAIHELLATIQKPVDEDQVYGEHVACELRAIRDPVIKRRCKCAISEALLNAHKEDGLKLQ